MIFSHPALRKAPAFLGLFAVLLWLPGCPLSPSSDDGGGDDNNTIAPERTTVQGAIDLFEFVWKNKRADLYDQLLHAEFEYFPQSDDVDDFPWLQGTSWSRTEELSIANNMFDPSFVSSETNETIDTIEMTVTVSEQRNLLNPPGAVEVTTVLDVRVLWAVETGAQSDVRLVFVLVPDPNDSTLWQIYQQQELPLF